jgi:hypothetical protein
MLADMSPVQALLLATQYLQGTQRSSQTWEMLGRLINATFRTGLWHEVAKEAPLEAEMRRRTWWACFVMNM